MKVTLEAGDFGWDYLLVAEDGRSLLVQTDWDYPGIASNLGWSPSDVEPEGECEHAGTDGTINCDCGVKVAVFLASAQSFLDDHIGEDFEDPGYFGEEA